MIDTSDFKTGMKIEYDGSPHQIVEFQHVKPGKGPAFVRTKLRNLLTSAMIDRTYRAGEKFEKADIIQRKMQYLYAEGDAYHFMDVETFDQFEIQKEAMGDTTKWLQESVEADVLVYQGRVIGVDLPNTVDLKIEDCPPAFKGDTANSSGKPATVETGATVTVPYFLNAGDVIRIDTRTGKYVTRV